MLMTKRRRSLTRDTITPMKHANIGCDEDAKSCIESGRQLDVFEPLPGYKAILQIDRKWVTTKFRDNIRHANTASAMVTYLQQRLNIGAETFNMMNWSASSTMWSSYGIARRVRTSKMMYCWLPVGHNWQKCNLKSDKCPCCECPEETFEHILSCKNEELQQVRTDGFLAIQRDYDAEKVPSNFMRVFLRALRITLDQASFPRNETVQSLQTALRTQEQIGFYKYGRGISVS